MACHSGTKEGVELGGNKNILSIDNDHNFYNFGMIYSEMSWAEFYNEAGIEDQIHTFTVKDDSSIKEDPYTVVENMGIVSFNFQCRNRNNVFPFRIPRFYGNFNIFFGSDILDTDDF